MTSIRTLDAMSAVLATSGPAAALAYLNEGVPHRFTAVYRFAGPLLHNVFLHDKAGRMRPDFLAVVPFSRSFCQFVVKDRAFRTDNSVADPRLFGHALRGIVISYHSVPVLDHVSGELWGTLSHFDMRHLHLPDEEFELLQGTASLLPRHLADI
ncbi:guanylate cyclase [Variovorax sp. J22P240]|uniref:GAF domain-containing protein n=1 Tax=unclassified Variovorax TaxID=663243 RepID=UPI00257493B9|nr:MULTISPECIES: GAF domain-containing protein [unclassified Variovorax]MDM0000603.1 guanylate cyclase [Variovorax sp. J22P240]MDM0052930.1 guanylate cyclase [Variovorax sp. J22R115]